MHRIGRTGRAGATGRATSFYTDRDSFLVAQIKHALAELEKGNDLAFATGKAARKKEREAAAEFRASGGVAAEEPALMQVLLVCWLVVIVWDEMWLPICMADFAT